MSTQVLEIVVPMAGRGSRFADVGYADPKPLIVLEDGRRMIEVVVDNLTPDRPHRFTFVVNRAHRNGYPLDDVLRRRAPGCRIIEVAEVTGGAAETVALALPAIAPHSPLMVANCDQFVDLSIEEYLWRGDLSSQDGYMMTMAADDPKWSYAAVDDDGRVTRVVEKCVISAHATVGIYNFRRAVDFTRGFDKMVAAGLRTNGEFYVAPIYNELINEGAFVTLVDVESLGGTMHGLGTPEDLTAFEDARRTHSRA